MILSSSRSCSMCETCHVTHEITNPVLKLSKGWFHLHHLKLKTLGLIYSLLSEIQSIKDIMIGNTSPAILYHLLLLNIWLFTTNLICATFKNRCFILFIKWIWDSKWIMFIKYISQICKTHMACVMNEYCKPK